MNQDNQVGWNEKKFDEWAAGVKQTLKTWDKNAECHICSLCGMNVEKLKGVISRIAQDSYAEGIRKCVTVVDHLYSTCDDPGEYGGGVSSGLGRAREALEKIEEEVKK